MDNIDTISNDIACSEYATGKIETARTFLALLVWTSTAGGKTAVNMARGNSLSDELET